MRLKHLHLVVQHWAWKNKVADQPQEIQAVSVNRAPTLNIRNIRMVQGKLNGFIVDGGGEPCR